MAKEAYYCTVKELNKLGRDAIPAQLRSNTHLIYSSPATLAFNSPGAEGFGVKRAGLAVPDSIMLIVAPGCCGRNTSLISSMREYDNRFFYLMMDETDIVTGRHLKKIPKAVEEICNCCEKRPSVVMICITCVDALLGTDMERVCRKAEERVGLPVRPCYMYALTREGRKPPMVHVRQSLYSLLEPKKKKGNVVNLLGFFSPLIDECELYDLLHSAGVKTIHEISRCKDYEEYQTMSEANFNLVLHPESRFAAEDFHNRLQIPFIELRRLYQTDKIASQYQAFGKVLGVTFSDEVYREKAEETVAKFKEKRPDASFAIGECMNGDPFEMALAMIKYGFKVPEIYGTLTAENFIYLNQLSQLSPETKVFSNMEPTMLYYDPEKSGVNMTIGKDAGYYHPNQPNVIWNQDRQPYGYAGVTDCLKPFWRCSMRGLRKYLTPFAPDQSGAVSVLYELGGIIVICDAGGCTGNVCGFDEPRWFERKSAVFSAGLRDMDAILGRDDRLVAKLVDAADKIDANFAAIVGTPVPAVIGTDYQALKRMCEKKTDLPILAIDTDGMELYDKGEEKAYLALFTAFAKEKYEVCKEKVGILGMTPQDVSDLKAADKVREELKKEGKEAICYGMGDGLEAVERASEVGKNIVVSVAALEVAKYLEKTFGTPYEIGYPAAGELVPNLDYQGKKILVVHQQVMAEAIRQEILKRENSAEVQTATWFMRKKELACPQDVSLREEDDYIDLVKNGGFDIIFADACMEKMVPDFQGIFVNTRHFAVSGRLCE